MVVEGADIIIVTALVVIVQLVIEIAEVEVYKKLLKNQKCFIRLNIVFKKEWG